MCENISKKRGFFVKMFTKFFCKMSKWFFKVLTKKCQKLPTTRNTNGITFAKILAGQENFADIHENFNFLTSELLRWLPRNLCGKGFFLTTKTTISAETKFSSHSTVVATFNIFAKMEKVIFNINSIYNKKFGWRIFTSFSSEMTAYDERKWRPVAFSSLTIVTLVYLSSKSAKKYGLTLIYLL